MRLAVKVVLVNDEDDELVLGTFSQGVRFDHHRQLQGSRQTTAVFCVASGRKIIQSMSTGGWLTEAGEEYAHLYLSADVEPFGSFNALQREALKWGLESYLSEIRHLDDPHVNASKQMLEELGGDPR